MPLMMRTTPAQSTSPMSAPLTFKRTYGMMEPSSTYPAGREIRPKMPSSGAMPSQHSPIDHPPRKKRGRPTKAEAHARAEAQSASSEPGSAPRPPFVGTAVAQPQPPIQPSEPLSLATPRTEEIRPAPVPRMSVSSMLTPTGQKSNSQSSSSSGKRRRGRSTRSEPEDLPRVEESRSRQAQEYESPYARMGAELEESPARTAVLRHRDEPDPRPPSVSSAPQDVPSTNAPPTTGPT